MAREKTEKRTDRQKTAKGRNRYDVDEYLDEKVSLFNVKRCVGYILKAQGPLGLSIVENLEIMDQLTEERNREWMKAIRISNSVWFSVETIAQMAQGGIQTLLKGRTSFIIAHRLSTIRNCARIVFVNDGAIEEQGTHDELMALKGRHCELCLAQYAE